MKLLAALASLLSVLTSVSAFAYPQQVVLEGTYAYVSNGLDSSVRIELGLVKVKPTKVKYSGRAHLMTDKGAITRPMSLELDLDDNELQANVDMPGQEYLGIAGALTDFAQGSQLTLDIALYEYNHGWETRSGGTPEDPRTCHTWGDGWERRNSGTMLVTVK